ncbi:hypothetical protein EON66_06400, partial [archaeon]
HTKSACVICLSVSRLPNVDEFAVLQPPVWDIEDIVARAKTFVPTPFRASVEAFGKRKSAGRAHLQGSACPFFTSKVIFKSADIVLCPYNYLLDPVIRNTLKIDLHNALSTCCVQRVCTRLVTPANACACGNARMRARHVRLQSSWMRHTMWRMCAAALQRWR